MSGKSEKKISFNKKLVIAIFAVLAVLVVIICVVATKSNVFNLSGKEDTEKNAGVTNGDKGYISSAQIIQTKTGTGPWDADDEPGNDSSEDNNIVRSFDQVTWTVDLTMALKSGVADSGLTGGIINVEVTLPETCADVMKWDLDSMQWIENGKVSSDGRTLTGQYSMSETDTTIPGKQTLVFVLDVEGAGNKTEIIPTFTFDLEGNEENDKVTITGEKIIVSAKGKYNIQLHRNEELATKTTVDYGEGNTEGRMYGYTFAIQLYNDNESKGLKGMEYPKGELSFDIDLKLERSIFGSDKLEDITAECTPILWQYNVNDWDNLNGNIEGRKFFEESTYFKYDNNLPLGVLVDEKYSTYNSGNININQVDNKLKVTINGYEFNGIFPHYNSAWNRAVTEKNRHKIYTDNIGTFSVGYMQIFVPDNDASTIRDRNYYLTVTDNNMKIISSNDEEINSQIDSSDDSSKVQHVLYNPGSYSQWIEMHKDNNASIESKYGSGDGKAITGSICSIYTKFENNLNNDKDVYTANRFIKFDGEGFEPVYYSDGSRYKTKNMGGNPIFRVWYVTKKDGKNWTSQTEMNNGNIEDMDIYDNIEDIPEGKICVGVYVETVSGYISRFSGDNNTLLIPLKIRETATIGKTYGITQRTQVWTDKLDRNMYSVLHPENKYPTPTWDSGNRQYIKTEYDENGEIIPGTHNGGARWGNTILVVGADLHGNIKAVDENNAEKVNYDLGKNENIVTYSIEPQLDGNTNIASQIVNITLKAEVTLAKGVSYIAGSTKRGESTYSEPEITNNSDGSQKLIWYIYGAISGKTIEPIKFNAKIDNETENGKQYEAKFVISEVTRITTNAQGEYEFSDLAKGTYKVEVELDNLHELTDKEVGTNREINSKFNQTTKQTDEITRLNTISSPELIEDNVNAGIRTIQFNITTKVEGTGGNISGEGQDVYESVDKGEDSKKDIIVSPNVGYRVNTITVNGEPISFEEETNHTVILDKFINMQENKEVLVTFKKIETSVLVHHYKENTTEQLSKDVTINGEVGDDYTTQVATDIPQNYELVATPANATGSMTEEQIVVTYYYRLKTPNITNQVINKTGTDRITVANQEMNYSITYRTEITDYIGNAEVTIIDTLPYAIDEGKSDLAGGTYDSTGKTITWTENISDINSFTGNGTVNITKTFKVVYVGLDMNQEKVVNNVKGNIKLLTPEKTSEEVTGSQESTIYKAIISSEKLVDKTEAIEGEKVTYTIRITNEGNLPKTVTVRDTLPAGITFDNDTLIQVGTTGTVYTEQNLKNGIPVEVPANGSIDVVFAGKVDTLASNEYSKTLTNQATVDNEPTNEVTTNVTKANITAHKESDPSSGNKVREGDEITYRIKVRNDGTRAGDVIVKDTIPTGTTFVEGSIKIDNVADSSKTATDLANGIRITVDIGKEVVVEFKVRVNKLIDGTKIKNTAYINQNGEDKKVLEEPEHTYVEPKEEQNITKTGTTTIESLNGEITYNINYTARITDYSGRATVKLVDKLPYAIDEAKSDLAGGTYDAQAQTITWEEAVEGIQLTEEKEVTINKTIKVVYTGITQGTTSVKNVVTGHIEYETPVMTSDEVTANWTTTTGFIINIPVSKVWEDDSNKLGQRPTKVVFKLHGSDGSEYIKEMSKPGTQGSTTTQDSTNPNKWNDIFENLPKYDSNNQEIVYTLTEEEKTEGDLRYYDSIVTDKTVTNTNKYGKVTVHHYIMNTDGSLTTTRVPDVNGTEIADVVIEGKEGDPYTTTEANNINEKYELVAERLPANATGTIEKYNEEKPQEVIYYYRLKPAKVLINYLEKDEDTDDLNNLVLTAQEKIDGHVDDVYNTDTDHRKETIEKDGKTYTLVSDSGNKTGNMTLQDITVTYYYLQNTKATVRYVERNPETHEIVKDLEEPTVKEGLVGDEFVTNSKDFVGYKLVESPEKTTINLTKEEQTLIYYYEPVYTGLIENHIDDKTGKILETETHEIQVGEDYDIPSKEFEGYDLVEEKLPENAEGTMGEELVTVNYYYIKKAVLEVNYVDVLTNEPLTEQVVDETKHEGDNYTTEEKAFENYDMIRVEGNKEGTLTVETDEEGNITNNRTIVTYYYAKKSAGVEEHHIDILTGEDIEEPTLHEGHVGDEYDIKAKEFLSYKLVEADEEGNSMLPTNAIGTMTEEKIVVNYYYNQPAKVIVHYVEKATGKELEETNPETGELQNSQIIIEGQKEDEYTTQEKEFEYYTLIERPQEEQGKMKVEIVKDEEGNDAVNNTIELYYYYEAKPFNIGVDKEITGIAVNGERREPTNGKLEKVEIYRKSTESTSVQVEYKIKVSNTGEVSGNATIEENIPEGMSLANNDGTWEEQEGKLIKVIPELGAGETKEYTVLLNWEQTGENMGEKANEVKLVETGNVPGFVDKNDKDNTSNANVIISVETGELPIGLILALVALVGLETVTLRYAVVLTKRQKKK